MWRRPECRTVVCPAVRSWSPDQPHAACGMVALAVVVAFRTVPAVPPGVGRTTNRTGVGPVVWSCDLLPGDHAYRNVSPGRRRLVGCSQRRYSRLICPLSRPRSCSRT